MLNLFIKRVKSGRAFSRPSHWPLAYFHPYAVHLLFFPLLLQYCMYLFLNIPISFFSLLLESFFSLISVWCYSMFLFETLFNGNTGFLSFDQQLGCLWIEGLGGEDLLLFFLKLRTITILVLWELEASTVRSNYKMISYFNRSYARLS